MARRRDNGRPIRAAQGRSRVDLTEERVEAAKACGCAFFPATGAQVARLSMQRRVFRIGGKPFMATRDGGGFFETHGTLSLLVGGRGRDGAPGEQETVHEAAAADAEAAAEIATEQGAARGGAQVVRHRAAGWPGVPPRAGKRGA
jgi:hypothetical protein